MEKILDFEAHIAFTVWRLAIICCVKMDGGPLGENTMYDLRIM